MQCTCNTILVSQVLSQVLGNLQLCGHDQGGRGASHQQQVQHQYLLQLLDLICSFAVLPFKAMHIIPMYSTSIYSCQKLSSLLFKLVCGMQASQQHRMLMLVGQR